MMRRAIIVLSWTAGVVVALLVALIVAVLVVDPDSYRPAVQRPLSDALGRLDTAALDLIDELPPPSSKKPAQNETPGWISPLDAVLQMQVQEIAGLPVALSGLSARGTLRNGVLDVRDFLGSVADTPVMADPALQFRNNRPRIVADVSVPVLDVSRLPRNSPEESGEESNALDVPLPLSVLRDVDADVKLDIARFRATPVSIVRLRAAARTPAGASRRRHGRRRDVAKHADSAGCEHR